MVLVIHTQSCWPTGYCIELSKGCIGYCLNVTVLHPKHEPTFKILMQFIHCFRVKFILNAGLRLCWQ